MVRQYKIHGLFFVIFAFYLSWSVFYVHKLVVEIDEDCHIRFDEEKF